MRGSERPHEISSPRLRLILMEKDFIEAVLAKRRAEAEQLLGASLPSSWPSDEDVWLLNFRLTHILDVRTLDPTWSTRALGRAADNSMIGHMGFHGPPDDDGVAEIGYTVLEGARRKGFAEEGVRALMTWAQREKGITRFRAAVGPWNSPSLALVAKLGFSRVGVQWDERDGEEIVLELSLPTKDA